MLFKERSIITMLQVAVFLTAIVTVAAVAQQCADFASFNIQVLGKTKVGKAPVMESLTKVCIIMLYSDVLKSMD